MLKKLTYFFLLVFTVTTSYSGLSYFVIVDNRSEYSRIFKTTLKPEKIKSDCEERFQDKFYQCFRGDIRRINRTLLFSNYPYAYKKFQKFLNEVYQHNPNIEGLVQRDLNEFIFDLVMESHGKLNHNKHPNKIIMPIEKSTLFLFLNEKIKDGVFDFTPQRFSIMLQKQFNDPKFAKLIGPVTYQFLR